MSSLKKSTRLDLWGRFLLESVDTPKQKNASLPPAILVCRAGSAIVPFQSVAFFVPCPSPLHEGQTPEIRKERTQHSANPFKRLARFLRLRWKHLLDHFPRLFDIGHESLHLYLHLVQLGLEFVSFFRVL